MLSLISDDATVRLKARGFSLIVPILSDEYRLEHVSDPLVKENQELRIELLKLRNTQPKLLDSWVSGLNKQASLTSCMRVTIFHKVSSVKPNLIL